MRLTIAGIVLALGTLKVTTASPIRLPSPQEAGSAHGHPSTPAQVTGQWPPITSSVPFVGPIGVKTLDIPTASPSDIGPYLDPTEIFPEPPAGSVKKHQERRDWLCDNDYFRDLCETACGVCQLLFSCTIGIFSFTDQRPCLYSWGACFRMKAAVLPRGSPISRPDVAWRPS
jgi:hypothetical protein